MAKSSKLPDLSSVIRPTGSSNPTATRLNVFAGSVAPEAAVTWIAPDRLLDNPYQPRKELDIDSIRELAAVIEVQGFAGTLEARQAKNRPGYYELTWGHRRREAARLAQQAVVPVIVRELSDEEMVIRAITENIQRQDLTPLEEGETFRLMISTLGYTQEQIAKEIGKDRGYVVNRLRAAKAPEDIRALVQAKPDSLRAVSTLIKVQDGELRAELISGLLTGRLTADDLPGYITAARHPAEQTSSTNEPLSAATPTAVELSWAAQPSPAPNTDVIEGEAILEMRVVPEQFSTSEAADDSEAPSGEAVDGRVRERVGKGKLSRILRLLTVYHAEAYQRDIAPGEFKTLFDIQKVLEDLLTQHAPVVKSKKAP